MLKRIFTAAELADAYAQTPAAQRLAARFSAKEAVVKALGALGRPPVPLVRIVVTRTAGGAPIVRIDHPAAAGVSVSVSLAHSDRSAIAYAIARVDRGALRAAARSPAYQYG